MSRMERVKDALLSAQNGMDNQIVEIHKRGQVAPADLIGMRNGLALANHHLQAKSGDPQFIQVDPRYAARNEGAETMEEKDQQEYEFLMEKIVTQARTVCWTEGDELSEEIKQMGCRIKDLDSFIDAKLLAAGKGEVVSASDASADSQGGSSPSPAASSPMEVPNA
jgi:hypothetical protein